MNEDIFEKIIERHEEAVRSARNEALHLRLAREKSFEDMLSELASLKGLNAEERAILTA